MSDSLPTPDARISDRDREDMANRLRDAYADGYLDREEFDDRLEQAFSAKVRSDLQPLAADLPEVPGQHADLEKTDRKGTKEIRNWAGTSVLLIAIWGISSIASGNWLYFWPIWPIGGWGAYILSSVISGDKGDDDDEQGDEKRLDPGKG